MTVPSLIRFFQPQPLADANGLATEPMIYDPLDPFAAVPGALPDGVVAIRPAGYPVPDFADPFRRATVSELLALGVLDDDVDLI